MKNIHKLSMIALLEPFPDSSHIQHYKTQLNMDYPATNLNYKIQGFWSEDVDCNVLDNDDQKITCEYCDAS